ncbi:ectoine/hydroxyectoine ABC transporter permease subunit EhuC [Limnochorda pilosa]|uniref:ectoine/hydroxyectoine ABC transporter permease subunit EhuC n=1 Tax=Limnochorda pilosa TaxID=1555112 RepID=UPI0026EEF8FB|nr:ectoine/hydroxyectoine ABC transporter permease subunit EhuC [Limnochorda pilosa]
MPPPFDLLPALLRGARVTVELTLLGAALALVLSFVVGFARLSRFRLIRLTATIYVEVLRGTSLLVQLFWIYFALPLWGINLSAMTAGVLAIGLNHGAYGSEIVRSAILAVPRGQTEAAVALNMTPVQRMTRVILPQAIPIMLPAFGNTLIELLKSTSLVSLITLADLTFQGTSLRTTTLRTTEIFSLLLILYFLLAYPLTLGVRWLERKFAVGRG